MSDNLAPIGLSTYARPQHLRQTIEALQKNMLASQSELYVFSDAPSPGDEERVAAVRSYLRTINGFKQVHIVERESNGRVANSRGGLKMLLDRFGKVIFLGEDVVTAPGFLTFMNEALDKYEGNDQVFSIAGYCPPIRIPANYRGDAFFLRRFCAWGFGTWKNRFDRIKYMSPDEYEQFVADKKRVKEFVNASGKDMMVLLKRDAYGEIDAGDVKANYAQFLSDQYTVYPCSSLIFNIGMDGTGVHCPDTKIFEVALSNKMSFTLPDEVVVYKRLVKLNEKFWSSLSGHTSPQLKAIKITYRILSKLPVPIKNNLRRCWRALKKAAKWAKLQTRIAYIKLKRQIVAAPIPVEADGKLYLHLGCGAVDHKKFINIDGYLFPHVHYIQSLDKLSQFNDFSVDLIYASHCLEHFSYVRTKAVLEEWYRVLKKGAILRLSVPDFDKLVEIYTIHHRDPDVILPQLMGGQDNKYNFHLTALNRVNLSRLLECVGFAEIRSWQPGTDDLTTFDDFSIYKKEVAGKLYEISLNVEAIK